MKVLIVDDNKTCRFLHTVILQIRAVENRFIDEIDEASDGLEAVNMCHRKSYDVVLMDIMMPFDGISAAKAIKAEVKNPPKIVFVSATPQKGIPEGGDGVLLKPITGDALRKLVFGSTC